MSKQVDSDANRIEKPLFLTELLSNHGLLNNIAKLFRSLGDETRIRILCLLSQQGELNVTQLCQELKQSQPAISHHLLQLRSAGLIDSRKDGKFNFYRMHHQGLIPLFQDVYQSKHEAWFQIGGLCIKINHN